MHFWYKFFTYLFFPFSPIYLFLRKLKNKEHQTRYKEKLSIIKKPRDNGFLIWLHVASVGEAMSIIPIIENCIEEKKINKILITSITLSSGKILEKKYNNNIKVIHQFLPLDIPILVKKFLEHWKPNLSIFIDSEIWPNLIFQIKKKNIPLLLINARITKKTYVRWKIIKGFAQKVFEKFDLCIASDKESEEYLKNLGAKNIKNFGNLKFSNTKNNFNKKLDSYFYNKIKNRKIWCAASTHPSEEIFCAKSHLEIKKKFNDVLTVIIPRHIDRTETINIQLKKLNLKTALYSKPSEIDNDTDILIVDSYGENLKFYDISKIVFLGKSTVESLMMDSGQNPIEPARFGCKVLHGPYVKNFREIYDYLKTSDITKQINSPEELSIALVDKFKENENKDYKVSEKIDNFGKNILNSVIKELKNYI